LIKVSSMPVTFKNKITLGPGAMFHFGTISCIAVEEGTLHRVADPPEKKPSLGIREKPKQEYGQHPLSRLGGRWKEDQLVRASLTQRTSLSTSPTKEWARITRKKEVNIPSQERRTHQATFSIPPPSKDDGKKNTVMLAPFYPDVLFILG
jgi:hypothetical protein